MGKRFTEDQLVLIKEICSEVVARCMEYGLKKDTEETDDIPVKIIGTENSIKRDKLMAIRFDKKMHKDISLIKLNYEIDIQDFVYVAVEKFMGEFFPNGKATKEGLEIVQQSLKRIYGKNSENE